MRGFVPLARLTKRASFRGNSGLVSNACKDSFIFFLITFCLLFL